MELMDGDGKNVINKRARCCLGSKAHCVTGFCSPPIEKQARSTGIVEAVKMESHIDNSLIVLTNPQVTKPAHLSFAM
jgi:hypothetical protein